MFYLKPRPSRRYTRAAFPEGGGRGWPSFSVLVSLTFLNSVCKWCISGSCPSPMSLKQQSLLGKGPASFFLGVAERQGGRGLFWLWLSVTVEFWLGREAWGLRVPQLWAGITPHTLTHTHIHTHTHTKHTLACTYIRRLACVHTHTHVSHFIGPTMSMHSFMHLSVHQAYLSECSPRSP